MPLPRLKQIIVVLFFFSATSPLPGGTWTQLAAQAPDSINLMLLLSDGSVMAQNAGGNDWYRLTPDIHGGYVNGSWTTLAAMHYTRLYYASDVLANGMVLVAGGEFGSVTGGDSEIYNPLSNVWTVVPVPPGVLASGGFSDSISKILPNGNVLVAPDYPATNGNTAIYITVSNIWSVGPKLFRGSSQSEASWVKLPDDSILTIDPYGTSSERYIPSSDAWVNDAKVPVKTYSAGDELGAAFLLPSGKAFFLGGNGNTAIYTPTGTTQAGTWVAGPVIANGFGIEDAPAAMMVNGKILCAVGNSTNYNAPTYFFEYDPVANSFAQVNGPTGVTDNVPPYAGMMLDLPDGTVLYSHQDADLYVYQPDGSPLAAGKPTITGIAPNADGSFILTGTLLNGISEGAAYGDDGQMNSNYPLVRMTNSAGNVYYERTYNWSSTSVMTGNKLETTEFTNSAGLPPGAYSLVVLANGFASDPVNFVIQPRLSIFSSGTSVVLSWPTNAVGFKLQFATNLVSTPIWNTNLPLPVVMSGQNLVTNQTSGSQIFFRLSQ
jgi:hypothetical protein